MCHLIKKLKFRKLIELHIIDCINIQEEVENKFGENSTEYREFCDSQIEYLQELRKLKKLKLF
jgi:hypothetical protein